MKNSGIMAADLAQHRGIVVVDIEHRQLARAAGGFKQPTRIDIKARRGIGVDVPPAIGIVGIGGVARVVLHIFSAPAPASSRPSISSLDAVRRALLLQMLYPSALAGV